MSSNLHVCVPLDLPPIKWIRARSAVVMNVSSAAQWLLGRQYSLCVLNGSWVNSFLFKYVFFLNLWIVFLLFLIANFLIFFLAGPHFLTSSCCLNFLDIVTSFTSHFPSYYFCPTFVVESGGCCSCIWLYCISMMACFYLFMFVICFLRPIQKWARHWAERMQQGLGLVVRCKIWLFPISK